MKRHLISVFWIIVSLAGTGNAAESLARSLVETSGVTGGLFVHVGCHDGKLTTNLSGRDHFVVQGLSSDGATVAAAREYVKSAGACGRVSIVDFATNHLPYVDELVNVLVVSSADGLSADEVERVLVPGGVALLPEGQDVAGLKTAPTKELEGWSIFKKPWPKDIDDWTHYLYNAQGSGVSADRRVGNPKGMRWTGGPLWARSHEHTASMQAMVSAAGRVFYVMDEGPTESIQLPSDFLLTARDAFNGVVLWKRRVPHWFNPLFPLKSGPGWMPRRLVAVEDRVYIAPGVGQKVLCLDAATGKVLHTYEETASTFELLVSAGIIFAAVDPDLGPCDYNQQHANCWKERDRANLKWAWNRSQGTRVITAIRASDGKLLWKREQPVAPMTLAADARRVCFYDGAAVIALDRQTGSQQWKTDTVAVKQIRTGYGGPRLDRRRRQVVHDDRGWLDPVLRRQVNYCKRSRCRFQAARSDFFRCSALPVSGQFGSGV